MKKNLFLMIAVLAASPVMGQDAKQIADSLSIPPVKAGAKQLPMPSVSGAQIKLLGADYEQLVNSKGKIAPVISDTPVNVSFEVTKDGKEAVSKDYEIMLQAPQAAQANPKPRIIPETLPRKAGQGEYKLGNTVTIACPDKELGKLFAADMEDVLGKKVKLVAPGAKADISLSLGWRSPWRGGSHRPVLGYAHPAADAPPDARQRALRHGRGFPALPAPRFHASCRAPDLPPQLPEGRDPHHGLVQDE